MKFQMNLNVSELTSNDPNEDVKVFTRCSTPYNTSKHEENSSEDSLRSKKMVLGQLSFSAPLKSAVVKSNKKSRPALDVVVK